jgi:DMSO/TMAO reductase YedYZ molybdopterin-dependent catalytic subunit
MTPRRQNLWAALVGVAAALATLAIAEAVAALLAIPASSPIFAVGSFVIDIVPGWFKTLVITLFGTADKIVLLVCLGVLVLLLAAVVGIIQLRRPPWGLVALGGIAVIAAIAAGSRAEATFLAPAPTLLGAVVGLIVLNLLTLRLRTFADASDTASKGRGMRDPARVGVSRRGFLTALGATAAGAVVVGVGARVVNAGTAAVNTVRAAITLPKAATPAPPVPAGAELGIRGLSPLFSANETFYRIDTALQVPVIDSSSWKLKVTGMVENEFEIGFDELLALPLTEHATTLMCVSNEVGGDLVGNAMWLGYPLRELLARAKPRAGADMVLSRSIDGFTAGTPLSALLDEKRTSLLAVGMNGKPLPIEHGFPARLVVPGLYGYVSATKWVVELKVTTFATDQGFWTPRGWSALGPVKTASRIDVPVSGAQVAAGTVAVAGVAWAQHVGIAGVEVRIDNGAWMPAKLADAISSDTWVQWVYEWAATPGTHAIQVRATDATKFTQSQTPVPVAPNGAEGWHSITVTAA